MRQSVLTQEPHNITIKADTYQTTFKASHGRGLYLPWSSPFLPVQEALHKYIIRAGVCQMPILRKKAIQNAGYPKAQ